MSLARTLRTARHIPPRQLAARARILWLRKRYGLDPELPFRTAAIDGAGTRAGPVLRLPDDILWPEGLDAVERRAADFARGRFVYLNREADFAGGIRWGDESFSPLWRYQLQYLGAVADLARTGRTDDAARVLTAWRTAFEGRWDKEAWHPYPASLRFVNLCVAASVVGWDALGRSADALAVAHAAYLLRHVEHDVRGNHILENARALAWAGRALRGGVAGECRVAARAILETEIPEQVLRDGGHFEMSPMYHCIVMRDLLEVRAVLGEDDPFVQHDVDPALARMATFLAGVLCPDGDIPLLGDSVRNFGPPPATLLRLAGVTPTPWTGVRSFPDTGLHVLRNERVWAIFDAGPVCPSYLPAHGQADTFTVEAWVDGACVVGDPGVHDYSGPERDWGRSSKAHSTVTHGDEDTSEVWGSFRVGRRAEVHDVETSDVEVAAGMTARRFHCGRSVRLAPGEGLVIADATLCKGALSRLHLAPGVGDAARGSARERVVRTSQGRVRIVASQAAEATAARASREFGRTQPTTLLVQPHAVPPDAPTAMWRAGWEIAPA